MKGMEPFRATFMDGQTATKHTVTVHYDPFTRHLVIKAGDGHTHAGWPVGDIRRYKDQAGAGLSLCLAATHGSTARLTLTEDAVIAALSQHLPRLDHADMQTGTWRKIVVWTIGAAAAMGLMIFVIVPALAGALTPLIPPEKEAIIGRSVLRQLEYFFDDRDTRGDWFCTDPKGQAALDKMLTHLAKGEEFPYTLNVHVVDHDMFNAFALPGGQMVIMRGLLDRADNAEQIAGVLAHELAHVAYRDPIEQALRAAGTAGLLSLMFGDATGATIVTIVGENLINANYSRAVERRADQYALARMRATNLSPEAFAGFFDLIIEEYGDGADTMGWFSTHPASTDRAANARAALEGGRTYGQVLGVDEWDSLRQICR